METATEIPAVEFGAADQRWAKAEVDKGDIARKRQPPDGAQGHERPIGSGTRYLSDSKLQMPRAKTTWRPDVEGRRVLPDAVKLVAGRQDAVVAWRQAFSAGVRTIDGARQQHHGKAQRVQPMAATGHSPR